MGFTDKTKTRPADAEGGFTLVSVNDEAVDKRSQEGKVAVLKYRDTREGEPLYLVGGKPLRFHCRNLPPRILGTLADVGEWDRNVLAFRVGVLKLSGETFPWRPEKEPGNWAEGAELLTVDCADDLQERIGADVIQEIGATLIQRARLSSSQKKAYLLPPGCRVSWESGSTFATGPSTDSTETPVSGGG